MEEIAEIGCSLHCKSNILICKTCGYGLHTDDRHQPPESHFRTYHDADAEFVRLLKKVFVRVGPRFSEKPYKPSPFEAPIPGLAVYHGWYCRRPLQEGSRGESGAPICTYLSQSSDHFLRHQKRIHSGNVATDFACQKVLMQSFFQNTYRDWFPVADLDTFDHRVIHRRPPAWRSSIGSTIAKGSRVYIDGNTVAGHGPNRLGVVEGEREEYLQDKGIG